ncbi:hypothetical protein D3C72_1391500 [compost metagenome]
MQGRDVLLERGVLQAASRLGLDGGGQAPVGAVLRVGGAEVGELVHDQALGGLQRGRVAEGHLDGLAVAADLGAADALVAEGGAQVARERFGLLVDGALHVDLQQEVDAAAQVQAQVHRERMQRREPLG